MNHFQVHLIADFPRQKRQRKRRDEQAPFKRQVSLGKGETTRKKEQKKENTLAKGLGSCWDARDGCEVLMQRQWDLYLQIAYLDEKWSCYHREFLKLFTRSVLLTVLKIQLEGADDSQHKSSEGS